MLTGRRQDGNSSDSVRDGSEYCYAETRLWNAASPRQQAGPVRHVATSGPHLWPPGSPTFAFSAHLLLYGSLDPRSRSALLWQGRNARGCCSKISADESCDICRRFPASTRSSILLLQRIGRISGGDRCDRGGSVRLRDCHVDSGRKTTGHRGCLDEEVLPVDLLRWLYRTSIVHGAAAIAVASDE